MARVRCPNCGKETEFRPENKFRPFCSERCRLLDLGKWADGSYMIPDEETPTPVHNPESEGGEDAHGPTEDEKRILH